MKRVFISFAIEDVEYRDHLVNQARNHRTPFEFMDMSIKTRYREDEWQIMCRNKIRRCHGAIVLLSRKTYHSSGARFEIRCAREEGVPIIGMHIFKNDKGAIPPELKGRRAVIWSWDNIEKFINSL